MTTLSIQPPYPIITGADGQPLEDGYVWIGTANLNPITNPIAVYWDAALTQPAALPVRTRGGYPVNAGTPARLYVGSDYSVLVQNKNGSTVYSAPSATERYSGVVVDISATDVSFLQAGSGAVTRTAQAKLREVQVSVKDFGATGDGVTDDRPFITAALNSLTAGGTLYFPPGDYNIKSPQISDAGIVLPVGVNLFMDDGAWLISTQGIFDAATGGSFIAPRGNNIIRCNIDGGAYPTSGGNTGTWATWANTGIRCYFSTSIGLGAENVIVENSEIKNVTYPLQIYGAENWRVYGSRFHRYKQTGILAGFYSGYNCQYNIFNGNNFEDAGDYAIAFFQVGGEAAGTGAYNVVANNIAKNMNQRTNGYAYGVEAGNPAFQYSFVFANNVYETDISTGAVSLGGITISTTQDCIVIGNRLKGVLGSNADVGINARSAAGQKARRGLIADNHIEGFRGAGIRVDGHDNVSVRGNVIRNCGDTSSSYPALAVALSDSSTGQVIENNTLIIDSTYPHYGAGTPAIGCLVAAGKTVSNVTIRGNTIINPNDYGIYCAGLSGNLIDGVNILNNTIIGTGDATFFQRFPIICDYVNRFSILGNAMREPRRGFEITNSTNGTVGENEIKGSLTLSSMWSIIGTTGMLLRNNECTAPLTAVFASVGSSTQLTTPANNNRAVGGSGLVVQSKGLTGLIATGATVSHGLSVAPTNVVIAPADTGVTDFFVSALGASTFTINYSGGGTHAFYWRAEF